MSRLMRKKKLIGGTSNRATSILYTPAEQGRARTNVNAELDRHNARLSETGVSVDVSSGLTLDCNSSYIQDSRVHIECNIRATTAFSGTSIGFLAESVRPSVATRVVAILRDSNNTVYPTYVTVKSDGYIERPTLSGTFVQAAICGSYTLD